MRSLPKADVFVAGVGPAGFIAAIAAMRNGAKVTLAEAFGIPGGMATAGLGGPISKFNFGGKRVIGGIAWGALSGWPQSRGVEDWRKIHPKDGSWERDLGQKEQEKPGE